MKIKIIITGTTGMVGEGVLLECLEHPDVEEVLSIVRKSAGLQHPKLKELIVPDFLKVDSVNDQLTGYDGCFYCAGVSSVGMKEADYSHITYDITIHFAKTLADLNPNMVFDYVSGKLTDSSEKGRMMWARVKGKTENELMRLPFKSVYNFRPGIMRPTPGQKQLKPSYKFMLSLYPVIRLFFRNSETTLKQVGRAMINTVLCGYEKHIIEVEDIKILAER